MHDDHVLPYHKWARFVDSVGCRLTTLVCPAVLAADTLRVCPMALQALSCRPYDNYHYCYHKWPHLDGTMLCYHTISGPRWAEQ
jgi:hypothetical protein